MINQRLGFVVAVLLGLTAFSAAKAQHNAPLSKERIQKVPDASKTKNDGQAEEQRLKDRFVKERRKRNENIVKNMNLPKKSADKIAAILESDIQARLVIWSYMSEFKGIFPGELKELAKQPGYSDLADALDAVNPAKMTERVRAIVGEEKYKKYRELTKTKKKH